MLQTLRSHMDTICLEDVTQGLRACFKVLSKIQMPVAYMDLESGSHTEEMELQSPEEETAQTQVRDLPIFASVVSFDIRPRLIR